MSIGLRIKELRNDLGLNQNDFAMKIGIKQSPLSQMEGGKILPSIETLSIIIREFNISYDWLIDGIGEKQKIQLNRSNKLTEKMTDFSEKMKNTKNLARRIAALLFWVAFLLAAPAGAAWNHEKEALIPRDREAFSFVVVGDTQGPNS